MPSCPRVVFLIDENVQSTSHVVEKLHLACHRVLSYFAYTYAQSELKSSILWGYKFFNSSQVKKQFCYKQCPFLDYTTSNFDVFEKELHERMKVQSLQGAGESKGCCKIGEVLKVSLTELLTDFPWDRPELFSPSKKTPQDVNVEVMNMVFLFASCPNNAESYFNSSYRSSTSFLNLLFPTVLYDKFIKQSKITLCWVNTMEHSESKNFAEACKLLSDGMRLIRGCVIPLHYLSMWWLQKDQLENVVQADIVSVSTLLGGLLPKSCQSQSKIATNTLLECKLVYQEDYLQHEIPLVYHNLCVTKRQVNDIESIVVERSIQRSKLSPDLLSAEETPQVYLLGSCPGISVLYNLFREALLSKEVLVVNVSRNDAKKYKAVMIPHTSFIGVMVSINGKNVSQDDGIENMTKVVDEVVKNQLEDMLDKLDFSTSLSNVIDPWFVFNPALGFPTTVKNSVRKLDISETNAHMDREENSKTLLTFLKERTKKNENKEGSKENSSFKPVIRKASKMKGMTWARWRLMQFKEKQADKTQKKEAKTKFKSKPDGSNVVIREDAEIVEPVDVKSFDSESDLNSYVGEAYKEMLSQKNLSSVEVCRLIKAIHKFFEDQEERDLTGFCNFVKESLVQNASSIREKYDSSSKDQLVHEYLLQVHLLFECITLLQEDLHKKDIKKMIISYLRSISFEENTFFLRNHLKMQIIPRYSFTVSDILRDIYEEMMFDFPKELKLPDSKGDNDGTEDDSSDQDATQSPKQLPSSVSYYSSDASSVASLSDGRVLRRHSSIINENTSSKRYISVQVKKSAQQKKKKRSKNGTASTETYEKVDGKYKQPNVPTTPKLKRRHSEANVKTRVPDTPESKQINDMIWKKQERDRRHAKVDKTLEPIKESPLKDVTSPVKCRSLLQRSNSFSCRSSPRRFYTSKSRQLDDKECASSSSEISSVRKSFRRRATIGNFAMNRNNETSFDSENLNSLCEMPTPVKLRRRNTLLSNFSELVDSDVTSSQVVFKLEKQDSGLGDANDLGDAKTEECKRSTRRNIFNRKILSDSSGTNSMSFESFNTYDRNRTLKRRNSSDDPEPKKLKLSVDEDDNLFEELFHSENTILSEGCTSSMPAFDVSKKPTFEFERKVTGNNPVFVSETTSDWLKQMEQDEKKSTPTALTFRDAFEKLSNTPSEREVKFSPTLIRTGGEIISVSPLVSASSLRILEKAPILSPESSKTKLRRRRNIATDYDK